MTVLNLAGFWALGLIPVLILIHRLRNKPARKEMTTLFIWEQVMKGRSGRISFHSLVKNRSLILQALTLLLLVLALTDPCFFITAKAPEHTILILDTSASMKTQTGNGNRFDKARQIALETVEDLTGSGKLMVIDAGQTPVVAAPFSADKARLVRAINRVQPKDVSGNMKKAVYLALSFLNGEGRIRIITDGAGYDLGAVVRMSPAIKPVIVRGGGQNMGITRFEFRPLPGEPDEFQVLVELKNYTGSSAIVPLEIESGNTPIARRSVGLASRERKTIIIPFRGENREILTARIRVTDDLESDNTVFGVFPSQKKTNVFLVSKGNYFLERLLTVDPGIQVSSGPEVAETSWENIAAGNDIVIFDNIRPPALNQDQDQGQDQGQCNFLLINTLAPGLPAKKRGTIASPGISGWDRHSPITRGLTFDGLVIREAMVIEQVSGHGILPGMLPGILPVLESESTPLIAAFENTKMKAVVLGFDIRQSDLPLRVAFPVLMKNIIQWLHPVNRSFSLTSIKAGTAYKTDSGTSGERVRVRRPSGEWEKIEESDSGTYTRTDEVGVYKVKTDGSSRYFAVNLTDEAESDIRTPGLEVSGEPVAGETNTKKSTRSARALFMAAALIVFMAETLFWIRKGGADAVKKNRIIFGCIKTMLIIVMVLALSDIRLNTYGNDMNIIFCLDRSLSMDPTRTEPIMDALNKTLGRLKETDRAGIVVFGKDPLVERELESPRPVSDIQTKVDRNRTDLEKALLTAIGQLSQGGKIVLTTDGNQNVGSGLDAARLARSLGIEIWPVSSGVRAGGNGEREVFIDVLETPEIIPMHTPFKIQAVITSQGQASCELIISRDNRIIARQPVDLLPGKNRFAFRDSITTPGLFVYKAVVNSPEDRVNENNEFVSFTRSKTPSLVMHVSSGGTSHFSQALKVQGVEVDRIFPSQFPNVLRQLLGVQAVVLDNVPATAFSTAQMENMETFVREAGGGLIMIGGEKSFGPGLYLNTPVEKSLPVFMDHPTTLEKPEFCLVLLIDKSASMAGEIDTASKLEGAKIAAFSTVEMLNPFDRIGLLAFDVEYQWVVPIGPAGNRAPIASGLSNLIALGGTNLFPALSHAFDTLKGVQARTKHIIVLSDGKTESADFKGLVTRMTDEKISISTVALGTGADRKLMKNIAAWGNGRTYYTRDTNRIPRIFAGDTKIAANQTIVEENLPVIFKDQADVVSGIPVHSLPGVQGMIVTHAKPDASVIFTTSRGPLLASRQYGLGRTLAFTSTFSGKWGEDWVTWPHFEKLASQMIKWVQKPTPHSLYKETITRTGDRCGFIVDLVDAKGGYVNHADLTLRLLFPSKTGQAQTLDLALDQVAPGRYQGVFNTRGPGEYYLTLHGSHRDRALPGKTFFLGIPYSPEYISKGENRDLLEEIAALTGGKVVEPDQLSAQLPLAGQKTTGDGIPLWPYFISLFAILFLADAAFCKVMALKQTRSRI